jgi:ATP-dependent exoDNAse (exonuclease V) beta subunit
VPANRLADLGRAITAAVPDATVGERADLEAAVVVLTVRQAKGLEFDSVLVAEPARILAESPRGHNDLYVALTRATQRLGVVHAGPPPAPLAGLTQPEPVQAERVQAERVQAERVQAERVQPESARRAESAPGDGLAAKQAASRRSP